MPEVASSLAPLRKTVVVPLDQSRAFELFTASFGEWWPLATHSVGLHDAARVRFPREAGGSIIETMRDGSTCAWGTVTSWDPPVAVCFTWHPGQPESWAGDIEVRFAADAADAAGATVVTLTHSGWERRADGATARLGYDSGWEAVLGAFGAAAAT
jgi:Activator of Hsp90 ATPase homolog 1-like protein